MPVEQMATMLNNIYPQMSKNDLKRVDKLPSRDKPSAVSTNATPSEVVSGTNAVSATLPGSGTNLAPHEVFFTVDKKANALILSGPVQELDKIETIISNLTASFNSNESEIRFFSIKRGRSYCGGSGFE